MDVLYTVLPANLSTALVCYAILLPAFASNMVLGLYHNINITRERFDAKRLWQGAKKVSVLVFDTTLTVTAVDAAAMLFTQYVPDVSERMHGPITVTMIAATVSIAARRYVKNTYSTPIDILNDKPSEAVAAADAKE